ncbi:MAG: hypothetical protein QXG03_11905, partial [Halalkalicoccus sp.]
LAALVWVVGGALEGTLWIVLIGLFVGFYADVVRYYLYGRGLREALSGPTEAVPEATITTASDEFVPATERMASAFAPETIPRIEEPAEFEIRTGGRDRERGWPDWDSGSEPGER